MEALTHREYATSPVQASRPAYTTKRHKASRIADPLNENLCLKYRWHIKKVAKYAMYWLCEDGNPYPFPRFSAESLSS